MHKVEIRLTNEGNDVENVFELYVEAPKDGKYVETFPVRNLQGDGIPFIHYLEVDERIVVVAKGNRGQMVFDKDQNANVRVETEAEREYRAELERKAAKHQADKAVEAANAKVQEAQQSAARAENDANGEVKKAEADRAKVEAEQAKNRATASEQRPANPPATPTTSPAQARPSHPGNPASANTGPVDSKQVKP